MAKTTDERSDLTDLVDYPRETLDIELKDWIDLGDKVAQAKLARHIAALANHGGGYLVFGFCDDESIAPNRPTDLSGYSRDTFGRLVTRYLTPAFQCDVQLVQSSTGLIYPVVRVPSHGSTPIGAKADGPHDPKGQAQGIRAGTYYVRKPGPKSEAALGMEDWQPLIRRCTLFDRDSLLADIARAVQPRSEPPALAIEDRLKTWHDESEARWRAILEKATALRWLVDTGANHCQLSYMILSDMRHVQLKVTRVGGKRRHVDIHTALSDRPSACVIWMMANPDTLAVGPFYWLGSEPSAPLLIPEGRITRHSKANAGGVKAERQALRNVPKSHFRRYDRVSDIADALFGPLQVASS